MDHIEAKSGLLKIQPKTQKLNSAENSFTFVKMNMKGLTLIFEFKIRIRILDNSSKNRRLISTDLTFLHFDNI